MTDFGTGVNIAVSLYQRGSNGSDSRLRDDRRCSGNDRGAVGAGVLTAVAPPRGMSPSD